MAIRYSRIARSQFRDIYKYSWHRWGKRKADAYAVNLFRAVEEAVGGIRTAPPERVVNGVSIFCVPAGSHRVYFRSLDNGDIGIITILHARMDLPRRLQLDAEQTQNDSDFTTEDDHS